MHPECNFMDSILKDLVLCKSSTSSECASLKVIVRVNVRAVSVALAALMGVLTAHSKLAAQGLIVGSAQERLGWFCQKDSCSFTTLDSVTSARKWSANPLTLSVSPLISRSASCRMTRGRACCRRRFPLCRYRRRSQSDARTAEQLSSRFESNFKLQIQSLHDELFFCICKSISLTVELFVCLRMIRVQHIQSPESELFETT